MSVCSSWSSSGGQSGLACDFGSDLNTISGVQMDIALLMLTGVAADADAWSGWVSTSSFDVRTS